MSKKKKYTKYDRHKKLITKIARQGDIFGVDKITDVPKACESMYCKDCLFHDSPHTCVYERKAWLNSKYEEPKRVFTKKQKNINRVLNKIKYIARDMDGSLWGFVNKPYKDGFYWRTEGFYCNLDKLISIDFPQITWEDEEPTSREEILGE